jgi:crossover junction endodeoxyribonuclease RuvC
MGYGVVDEVRGRLVHIGHGVLKVDPEAPLHHRLHDLFGQLSEALALFRPEAVAVEGVFTFKNARSALVLGHARGVALLVAAQTGVEVHEYAPAQVKRSVGAGGASGKDAVAKAVQSFLGIQTFERADASDALAIAICHLNHARLSLPVGKGAGKKKKAGFADRLSAGYRPPPVLG